VHVREEDAAAALLYDPCGHAVQLEKRLAPALMPK